MSTYPPCVELSTYLLSDDAQTLAALAQAVGVNHTAQIRHWRDGIRRPRPESAVALEGATKGAVPRHVWYPKELVSKIWPDYVFPETAGAK